MRLPSGRRYGDERDNVNGCRHQGGHVARILIAAQFLFDPVTAHGWQQHPKQKAISMDGAKFDNLTRLLFTSGSRRVAIAEAATGIGALISLDSRNLEAKGGGGKGGKGGKRGKGGGKKKGKKKDNKKSPPPNPVCTGGGAFCGAECCPPEHMCVMTVVPGEDKCCPKGRFCTSAAGELRKCCPASPERVSGCCETTDPEGNLIVFCCYGERTCGFDEDGNGSCCLPGQKPCGGSCCASDAFCCARTKNGQREYACCPNDGQTRCMVDRPDLRPCCSNC